jgi:kumamolisin
LAVAILLAPTFAFAASPSRDPEVALPGNTVAGLNQAGRIADEDAGKIIDVQLALKLRNRAQLDDLIRRVSTPHSPDYGHYLTPDQFSAQFGPTAAQVDQAAAFLRAKGLQVTAAAPGSTLVDARGTVAAVQQALHTQIGHYREPGGREFFANDTAPALPSSLAANITGVQGLDNRYQRHHSAIQPRVCPPTCAGTPYTPTQVRTGFGLATAPLTTLDGTGQTLGLLELDDFRQANIDGYDTAYSLPALTPQRQVVDFGPGISNAGEIEVELDIEVMHALAPGATILVFEGPNSDLGVNDTYGCMVDPNAGTSNGPCPNHASGITAPSNSTSWGLCEPLQMLAETNTLGAIFAQGAAQGQSFFAASGDTGAYDCYPDTSGIWVDSPASDPDVTGVGGTKLFLNPDNSYNSETAWPREPQAIYGSGGGKSIYFSRPSWQTGPGVITTANAPRQVPDVSLDADPVTGYSVYTCLSASIPCTGSGAGFRGVGGTSAGAPAWAAFTAIYNQYATCQGKPSLGFANPTLYSLGSNAQTFTPFNDITTGDNKEGTALGYSAGANFDMVTGWGTLRAAGLAQDVAGTASSSLLLSTVAPSSGSTAGGTAVTLFGCGFVNGSTVKIDGSIPATNVQFVSSTTLTATMPAHALGSASITVVNPGPVTSNTRPFTYVSIPRQYSGRQWAILDPSNNKLTVFGLGSDNTIDVATQSSPGVWSTPSFTPIAGGPQFISDAAVARDSQALLEAFAIGGDSQLYRSVQANSGGAFNAWHVLAGGLTFAGQPVVGANADGRLEIFIRGMDGAVWTIYETAPGNYASVSFGGPVAGDPSVGHNADGRLEYFVRGTDGGVWTRYQLTPSGGWSNWYSFGGFVPSDPEVGYNGDGRMEFFVRGNDNAMWTVWQTSPNGNWSGYLSFGGSFAGNPSLTRNADGRAEYFARSTANTIRTQWQTTVNGGWSAQLDFQAPAGGVLADPATAANFDGTATLFARGSDNSMYYWAQTSPNGDWTARTLLGGSLAP